MASVRRSQTLAIVPALNEADSIENVIKEVLAADLDCLVIDDGSRDQTAAIVRTTEAQLLQLPINLGVGGALRAGFRFAVSHGYSEIVQIDGDGQHIASEVSRLIAAADRSGADMVVGSRFAGNEQQYQVSRVRRACMSVLARRVRSAGLEISDATSGFRLIREPLLSQFARDFPAHYLGDTFEALVVAGRRGYVVLEVPVEMRQRQGGRPSADITALVRSMVRSLAVGLTGPSFDVDPK
jgi:glycosyltransferase involved in cell wall biosynthesis